MAPIYRKKLIEVALPLEAINIASSREKSIRHGHPSTLHLWWARRPLAAARAVIFTSLRTPGDKGYAAMTSRMLELASKQPGFLGVESARDNPGITVSYWADLESIKNWKENPEHKEAQKTGYETRYSSYKTRISKVERDYSN